MARRAPPRASRRKRVRSLLVTAEVTLALVLLVGAGLMGRTMLKLGAVDPGFRTDHLAVANVSLAGTPHAAPTARDPMFLRVRDRLASLPGVTAVSAINHLPLAGDTWTLGYTIEGRPLPAPGERSAAVYRVVQPGYFGAMELPLLAGRDFTAADSASAPHVAIINKAMADHRWPGESPVGRRITLPGVSNVRAAITIVGVAANARQSDWTAAPDDEVYLAYAQRAGEFGLTTLTFVLRTSVDPASVAAIIPREVAELERSVPVTDAGTMSDVVADELWRERLTAQLTGIFAAVALVLAAIGVYAVVAYSVARRTREIGVRVALGATRGHVVLLALGEALRPVMTGAILGARTRAGVVSIRPGVPVRRQRDRSAGSCGRGAGPGARGGVCRVAAGSPSEPSGPDGRAAKRIERAPLTLFVVIVILALIVVSLAVFVRWALVRTRHHFVPSSSLRAYGSISRTALPGSGARCTNLNTCGTGAPSSA